MDGESKAVMMAWEKPLMEAHAKAICSGDRHVLNIGYGMGLVDTAIQQYNPLSHTIIEAHPEVYDRMLRTGWGEKENVKIIFGRWQDVLSQLKSYDGIHTNIFCWLFSVIGLAEIRIRPVTFPKYASLYRDFNLIFTVLMEYHVLLTLTTYLLYCSFSGIFFDTYGEYYEDMREFHQQLPHLLKPGGIYSFFNGFCGSNAFFHLVYCQLVALELEHLGYSTQFIPLPVKDCLGEETWEGVRHKYWQLDTYYLPVCQYSDDSE